jgi:DoxX-like protein
MNAKSWITKVSARVALGLVWLYEGLVPKILFLRADEIELVRKSGLIWETPERTLLILGLAQIGLGLWLIVGWMECFAVAIATLWMCALIIVVVGRNPSMLTDPYGALVKDLCLIACAITVWVLAPRKGVSNSFSKARSGFVRQRSE